MRKQRHAIYTHCPVEAALDIIGGKWKAILLFRILEETRRFNELRRLQPTLTQRMLTNQLRELERDGLITRKIYPEMPPKVEYSITEFGRTLEPLLLALTQWAEQQMLPRMAVNMLTAPVACAAKEKTLHQTSANNPSKIQAQKSITSLVSTKSPTYLTTKIKPLIHELPVTTDFNDRDAPPPQNRNNLK